MYIFLATTFVSYYSWSREASNPQCRIITARHRSKINNSIYIRSAVYAKMFGCCRRQSNWNEESMMRFHFICSLMNWASVSNRFRPHILLTHMHIYSHIGLLDGCKARWRILRQAGSIRCMLASANHHIHMHHSVFIWSFPVP